jgi:hypothetical protein
MWLRCASPHVCLRGALSGRRAERERMTHREILSLYDPKSEKKHASVVKKSS